MSRLRRYRTSGTSRMRRNSYCTRSNQRRLRMERLEQRVVLATYQGHEYLLTSAAFTWEEAQIEAEDLGGSLVTVNDAAEDAWLKETFGTAEGFWIGINDIALEGVFQWASGEPVTYTNWAPGEPNNGDGLQDFGWMNYGGEKQWDDHYPTAALRGIIEIDPNDPSNAEISLTADASSVNEATGDVTLIVQRTGNTGTEVTVDYQTVNGSATAAEDFTAASGTLTFVAGQTAIPVVVSINNDAAEEGNEQFSLVLSNVTGNAVLGSISIAQITIVDDDSPDGRFTYNGHEYLLTTTSATWADAQTEAESLGGNLVAVNDAAEEDWLQQTFGTAEGFWIGINDSAVEGTFQWASGEPVTYTNWAPGEPNNGEGLQDFGWMNYDSENRWDDHFPTATLRGIIEIDTGDVPAGVVSLATSTINVNEDAGTVSVAIERTGTATDAVTVDYRTIDGTATTGEDFTSISGTAVFAPGETVKTIIVPITNDDLLEGSEQFGFTIDNVTGNAILLAPRTAQITIVDDETPDNRFTYNGHEYLLTSFPATWQGAQSQAENLGGYLVTVNDSAEESWLKQTFGTAEGFWIGLNDVQVEGTFEWANGEPVTFTNWAPGEPNNGDGLQDFAWMNYDSENRWDDHYPTATLRGIIEIDVSDPNPVPDPTLIAEIVVTGLNFPTAMEWTPDGQTMFIAEKSGVVRIFENGSLAAAPFIDISAQVNNHLDRGLLDIELHPAFPSTPYVYLSYAYDPPEVFQNSGFAGPDGQGNRAGRLARVTADVATGFRTAVPGSEEILVGVNSTWENFNGFVDSTADFDEPPAGILPDGTNLHDFLAADSTSHTVGSVEFGPDGALYFTNGDGASFNNVDPRAVRVQDIDNLSGKLLRIDPITGDGLPDNPFYNGDPDANRSKVYQYGFRNPFRIAVDPVTGQVFVGDVGWAEWEEVNTGPAGANFGWPFYEGGSGTLEQTSGYRDLPEAADFYNSGVIVTPSIFALNHATDGINAIVLGDLYTGSAYPAEYQGDLFINDLGQGIIRHISFDADGNVVEVDTFALGPEIVVQITMGPDGLLYFVDLDDGLIGRWVFLD